MDTREHDNAVRLITGALDDLAKHLVIVRGIDPNLVLATLHSQALTMIATHHGGDVAARCARDSASTVEALPSYADCALAAAPVAGRA